MSACCALPAAEIMQRGIRSWLPKLFGRAGSLARASRLIQALWIGDKAKMRNGDSGLRRRLCNETDAVQRRRNSRARFAAAKFERRCQLRPRGFHHCLALLAGAFDVDHRDLAIHRRGLHRCQLHASFVGGNQGLPDWRPHDQHRVRVRGTLHFRPRPMKKTTIARSATAPTPRAATGISATLPKLALTT